MESGLLCSRWNMITALFPIPALLVGHEASFALFSPPLVSSSCPWQAMSLHSILLVPWSEKNLPLAFFTSFRIS